MSFGENINNLINRNKWGEMKVSLSNDDEQINNQTSIYLKHFWKYYYIIILDVRNFRMFLRSIYIFKQDLI